MNAIKLHGLMILTTCPFNNKYNNGVKFYATTHFELLVIQGTLYSIIVLFGKIMTGYL